ncbi:MAG: 3-deoxy-D-manno-octulosonic acid transferase [Candidatus Aureabacteria bacterium]|nr:3-deoxy-D-manno-octulosonic acid transferase [Candidatus Auribacterota bacterium]
MLLLYNALVALYFIVTLPYYAVQILRKEKYRAGILQRLGLYPGELRRALTGRHRIWFHAVSVGEVRAVTPLLKLVREELPGWQIVLSTVTLTGQTIARETCGSIATVIYFPLDLSVAGSFPGYQMGRFFLKHFLQSIRAFSMQTDIDARRILAIGAPRERVTVGGNMKFDCGISPTAAEERRAARAALGLAPGQPVLVAGSTHRGEEEILVNLLQGLRGSHPDMALIIVPRHPERGAEVQELIEKRGERCVRRSSLGRGAPVPRGSILIADTIGELVNLYKAATVVFVGKSLVPGGGQNIIEPASMGLPVIFGPSMENFREASELLIGNGGAIQVENTDGLRASVISLFDDAEAMEVMGRRAADAMARSRGATRRNLELIKKLVKDSTRA